MKRFWFEFNLENYSSPPPGIRLGCGVTADSTQDALGMLQEKVFLHYNIPPVLLMIEDVDVSSLDDRVIPNMAPPIKRGVWFPLGYQ